MSDMLSFCSSLLQSIVDIVSDTSSPFFWLFGVLIFSFIVRIVLDLVSS